MVNDVEKRWSDPEGLRQAIRYDLAIVGITALVALVATVWAAGRDECLSGPLLCDAASGIAVLLVPALVLVAGGIGAFVITYLRWRQGRVWPIWQGAGWFLFMLMLVYVSIGGSALAR
ncbi:hypothetical protein [Nocardia bhagyanarayanae]|uniref:Uncharacterized protein n=1 Tax=Nocardia bhagyanarayanae TaxID=1215925 RepID=A0A543FII8_9NOCA|nr:hypothetical protein [Nocardia bhagyanarayanae]TQM33677.1 hypothetical protein FB390_5414 [Nocardia bhagyanarayanae]